jgi:hypothetical protein
MHSTAKPAIIFLVLAGISDLAAVPLIAGSSGKAPAVLAVAVVILALASIVSAIGLSRQARWARPVGIASRAIDVITTIPALFVGGGGGLIAAAGVTVAISVAALALLMRADRQPAVQPLHR